MDPMLAVVVVLAAVASGAVGWALARRSGPDPAAQPDTAAADLRARKVLLEAVLDAAPLALVLCDQQGVVTLANAASRDLFAGGGALEGRRFDEILASCPPGMADAVRSQSNVLFTIDADQSEESYLLSRPSLQLDARWHTLYVVTHVTKELSRQEVAIWKKVIRVISHELNNSLAPMSSLVHSARLIAGDPAHAERMTRIFDTVEERVRHLQAFLDSYARFARLPPPQHTEVEWGDFLDHVRSVSPFSMPDPPPDEPGWFDPTQLQQVLINLLKNAREAGSDAEGTTVRVEAVAGGGVRISVIDSGGGMGDDALRDAVLPFYSTRKKAAPGEGDADPASGLGLGLALTREIVDAHGGTLRLERRPPPDTGVAAHVTLPPRPPA